MSKEEEKRNEADANGLTITNDSMFCCVMQKLELCQGLIERILSIKLHSISQPEAQVTVTDLISGKGSRFDIYFEEVIAETDQNKGQPIEENQLGQYNLEM